MVSAQARNNQAAWEPRCQSSHDWRLFVASQIKDFYCRADRRGGKKYTCTAKMIWLIQYYFQLRSIFAINADKHVCVIYIIRGGIFLANRIIHKSFPKDYFD